MSPQYLADMEEATGRRPGLAVVASVAHALGVTTDTLLAEAGFPSALAGDGRAFPELDSAYSGLDEPFRHALLRNARTLRDLQAEYEMIQRGDDDEGDADERPATRGPKPSGQGPEGVEEELPPERELAAHPDTPEEMHEATEWENDYLDQEESE